MTLNVARTQSSNKEVEEQQTAMYLQFKWNYVYVAQVHQ